MKPPKALIVILIFALVPRLYVALSSKRVLTHDDSGYQSAADSILYDGLYGFEKKPVAFKPPFYPYFLAFIYRLFGNSYTAARIAQAVLGGLTCVVVYFIAFFLAGANTAFIAGMLAAVNISFVFNTECIMPEALAAFLFSIIVFLLIRLRQSPSFLLRVLIGFLSGLLTLTRSETIFFLPLVFGIGLILTCFKDYPLKVLLKDAAVVSAAFLIVVGSWTYRNWRIFHAFVPVTTSVGINLYSSYCPTQGKIFGLTAYDDTVKKSLGIKDEVKRSKFLAQEAFKYIKNNPDKLPRLELLKFGFFWSFFDWEIIGPGVYNYFFAFLLPFFILGVIAAFRDWRRYYLLYAVILFSQLLALGLYGSPRFRLPYEPFIVIFSAIGITKLYDFFTNKRLFLFCFAVFFIFNLTLYFYSGAVKGQVRRCLAGVGVW